MKKQKKKQLLLQHGKGAETMKIRLKWHSGLWLVIHKAADPEKGKYTSLTIKYRLL